MSNADNFREISGNANEAKAWVVSSSISEDRKEKLLDFINRFPELRFYKQEQMNSGPLWLKEIRTTLEGVVPDSLCWFHFDNFDTEYYDDDMIDLWYHRLSFDMDISSEYDQVLMDDEPLLFVGAVIENLESLLAVRSMHDTDYAVYGLNYRSIQDIGNRKGRVFSSDLQVVFESYTSMLHHIDAVKLQGENIVEALVD